MNTYYYLDDWVILADSPTKCLADLESVVRHITNLDFAKLILKPRLVICLTTVSKSAKHFVGESARITQSSKY